MIIISLKPTNATKNGETLILAAKSVFINSETLNPNSAVIHLPSDEPFGKLFKISLDYKWELYRYSADNHVGLTVNLDEIYSVKYTE
jgi:hypothetical protein